MKDEFILRAAKSWPAEVKAFLDRGSFYRDWFFVQAGWGEAAARARRYDEGFAVT